MFRIADYSFRSESLSDLACSQPFGSQSLSDRWTLADFAGEILLDC
jgi:hypothetical protein